MSGLRLSACSTSDVNRASWNVAHHASTGSVFPSGVSAALSKAAAGVGGTVLMSVPRTLHAVVVINTAPIVGYIRWITASPRGRAMHQPAPLQRPWRHVDDRASTRSQWQAPAILHSQPLPHSTDSTHSTYSTHSIWPTPARTVVELQGAAATIVRPPHEPPTARAEVPDAGTPRRTLALATIQKM